MHKVYPVGSAFDIGTSTSIVTVTITLAVTVIVIAIHIGIIAFATVIAFVAVTLLTVGIAVYEQKQRSSSLPAIIVQVGLCKEHVNLTACQTIYLDRPFVHCCCKR